MHLDRRTALLGLAATGASVSLLIGAARAQTEAPAGSGMEDYVQQTLTVGSLALQTSQVAADKATDPNLKQFATLEVAEQQAIAGVLAATPAGKTPPALPEDRQKELDQLKSMQAGPEFDKAYLDGQMKGHEELLAIQKSASGATEASVEAITARLAEQAVTSHIAMLKLIQTLMTGAANQNIQQGKEPDAGAAPADANGADAGGNNSGGENASGTEGKAPSSSGG